MLRHLLPPTLIALTLAAPVAAQDAPAEPPANTKSQPDTEAQEGGEGGEEQTLPIRRITLYTSGVAFYEHSGEVAGRGGDGGEVRLTFQQDQLNDVLKSLAVWGGQGVPRVKYASKEPLSRQLASFGINLANDPSVPALLSQLRGATVTVTTPEPVTGRILNVEQKTRVVGQPAATETYYILSLVTDGGIRRIDLEAVNSIRLEDTKLQKELDKVLELLLQSRDGDTKPLTIDFVGAGDGDGAAAGPIGVSYLIEAPVWKTSYRLNLSDAGETARPDEKKTEDARLQGWAIVENVTETDWNDVKLTLISGRPISFVQDLYTPLYLNRPVVQPELYASLNPKRYEGGWGDNTVAQESVSIEKAGMKRREQRLLEAVTSSSSLEAPAAASRARLEEAQERDYALDAQAGADGGGYMDGKALSQAMQQSAVASAASRGNVGELFQYTLDQPLSLPRQQSAMVPILSDDVAAEKLSIYNPSTHPTHPLSGARLTNTTDLKLMSGPITVYDAGRYVGDAQISFMGPGDERLLSYAVDLELKVDPSVKTQADIVGGKIVRGTLMVERRQTYTQTYTAKSESDRDKVLIIEHNRRPQLELIAPKEPMERTEGLYRFQMTVPADETADLTVKESQTTWQNIAILNWDIGDLLTYTKTGKIDRDVRDAILKAIELRQQEAELRRQIAAAEREYQRIAEQQSRIRSNMGRLSNNSSLHQRYIKKLADQEDQVEEIQTRIDDLTDQANGKQRELADYLQGLNVGGDQPAAEVTPTPILE